MRGGWRGSEPPSSECERVLSRLDGKSDMRSESCLLNGDVWLRWLKPLKEPCRTNIDTVACGLSIACVVTAGFGVTAVTAFVFVGMGGASVATKQIIKSFFEQLNFFFFFICFTLFYKKTYIV